MRSLVWTLIQYDKCFYKKLSLSRQRENGHVKMAAEIGLHSHKPRNTRATRRWKRQGRILPNKLRREHSPDNNLMSDFLPPAL